MSATLRLPLGLVLAGLLALGAVLVLPGGGGETPGTRTLVTTATAVALVTGLGLWAALRWELRLPASIALFAVGYNALVVLVKFVLGPQALYEASEAGQVDKDFGALPTAAVTAGLVGSAYLGAFYVLYRIARTQLTGRRARPSRAWIVVPLVLVLLFVSGMAPGLLLLLFYFGGGDYVAFVFTSAAALVAAGALALAASLALVVLTSTAERARALGDATLLTTVFWVGVAYLTIYHGLWIVYVLVLTSIWPLKVVTSK